MMKASVGDWLSGKIYRHYFFGSVLLMSLGLNSGCYAPGRPGGAFDKALAAQARVQLGLAYLAEGALSMARQQLELALAYQPQSAQVQGAMARYQQQAGEPEAAQGYYQRALRLDAHNGTLLHHYATFLCEQRRYTAAQHYFQQALQAAGYADWVDSLHQAGWCYLQAGQLEAAKTLLQRALKHQPEQGERWISTVSQALSTGSLQEATQGLALYDALHPPTAKSLWLHSRLAARVGATAAVKYYGKRLLQEFPSTPYAHYFLQQRYQATAD